MLIETLLTPVDPQAPCGENLEYDADFLATEQASTGKTEQQFGSTIIPAQPPDWIQVERLASGLLARSKDLRIMMYLTHAWVHLRGLAGYADGLALIHQALLRYWPTLHPQLEIDGEADALYRASALAWLGDNSALTASVRNLTLLSGPAGEITLRDAISLLDGSKAECPSWPGGLGRLKNELHHPQQPVREALVRAAEYLNAIRATVIGHLGDGALPEMTGVIRLFAQLSLRPDAEPADSAAPLPDTPPASAAPAPPPDATVDWRGAQIRTRDDARRMLSLVIDYFHHHEPSHPAPLLLERVQRLIEMDFMQLVRDLAPDGMNQLENVLGRPDSEERA
ncbi:type VI secretion system protein TssA [Entomohabitans teleogrylli]|uniref:type VI secretion system protein TssA n=1 Tax=Entomohabitans teleogrylli TaxID=1384589 RepID=UPI00073D4576|nr:type VI secretion system protein TssA [Entomohabitans teleogrylli]